MTTWTSTPFDAATWASVWPPFNASFSSWRSMPRCRRRRVEALAAMSAETAASVAELLAQLLRLGGEGLGDLVGLRLVDRAVGHETVEHLTQDLAATGPLVRGGLVRARRCVLGPRHAQRADRCHSEHAHAGDARQRHPCQYPSTP